MGMIQTVLADRSCVPLPLLAMMLAVGVTVAAQAQITIDTSPYRIGISSDGNQHDPDDIGAAPMALAMIAEAGLTDRLVHHDFNNHLGDNDPAMAQKMVQSVTGAADRWGFDQDVFFNDQKPEQLEAAVANLAAQIKASGPGKPFFIAAGGPMETVWRGINASDPAKREYVVVISHHPWNDNHADTKRMTHTWADIKRSGVATLHIGDQNKNLSTRDRSAWAWLKDSEHDDWRWLHSRDQFDDKFDVSDAGMVWYILTGRGDTGGTPDDVKALFDGAFRTTDTAAPAP